MFNGLKEKLGRFREDAEEVAAENAEVEEPAETTADDAPAEATDGNADDTESTDAGASAEPEAPVEAEAPTETPDGEPAGVATAAADRAVKASAVDDGADGGRADDRTAGLTDTGTAANTADAGTAATDTDSTTDAGTTAGGDGHADNADAEDAESADDAENGDDEDGFGFARKARSAVRGRVVIEEDDLEDPLWELEMALLESDVEMSVANAILDNIRDELVGQERKFTESTGALVEAALREALLDVIGVGQFDFDQRVADADKPLVIVFTGINGVGKTTSIAKLSKYLHDRGFSSVIANGDTYRAGANEQVREHAENLDTKLITHEQGGDPAAVIYDAVEYAKANDVDVVLGDTAGRLHTSSDLMEQLAKIDRVVDPDMTLFVDEAVAGQDAVNRAREFDDAAAIDGAILTKADADSQGGAAISIAHVTGKPILFLGVGQGYDDVERFDPEALVDDLLDDE